MNTWFCSNQLKNQIKVIKHPFIHRNVYLNWSNINQISIPVNSTHHQAFHCIFSNKILHFHTFCFRSFNLYNLHKSYRHLGLLKTFSKRLYHASIYSRQNNHLEEEDNLDSVENVEDSFFDDSISHQFQSNNEKIDKLIYNLPKHIKNTLPPSAIELFHLINDEKIVQSIISKNVWSIAPIPSYYAEHEIREWIETSFSLNPDTIIHIQKSFQTKNTWLVFLQGKHFIADSFKTLEKNSSYSGTSLDILLDKINDFTTILEDIRMWKSFNISENQNKLVCLFIKMNKNGREILNIKEKSDSITFSNIRNSKQIKKEIKLDTDVAFHLHKLLGYPPIVKTILKSESTTSVAKSLSNNFSDLDNCHRLLVLCRSSEDAWSLLARLSIQPIIEKNNSFIEVVHSEKW